MARTGKTRTDWVQAGQALLVDGGIEAVKLQRLTERLNVTTGSFYHHFRNLDEFLCALSEYYGSKQAQLLFDRARMKVGDDPESVLRESTRIFGRGSMRLLNIAMRAWAHSDKRAAAAVRRFDKVLMGNLDQIFLELGFDELEAKSRTLIMMGLSSIDFDPKVMQPTYQERWVVIRDLITRRFDKEEAKHG
jgi:AcrR family transcriptional regulator